MHDQPIRVLIVDDHALVRKGLAAVLSEFSEIQVVGSAPDGYKAIELVEHVSPDLVLIDLVMPGLDGIETIKRIITVRPEQRILVLTGYLDEDKILPAIKAGALGYLLKDVKTEELVESIQKVYSGEPALNSTVIWKYLRKDLSLETKRRQIKTLSNREIDVMR